MFLENYQFYSTRKREMLTGWLGILPDNPARLLQRYETFSP
jgi:hypothetical protein